MPWQWLVTIVLLVYIAALATYREYVDWRLQQIDIRLMFGFVTVFRPDIAGTWSELLVAIRNHSNQSVTFRTTQQAIIYVGTQEYKIEMKPNDEQSSLFGLNRGMTFVVRNKDDGEKFRTWLRKNFADTDVKMRARVEDTAGRHYYSEWRGIEWAKH